MCKWYSSQLLRDILLERSNSAVMMRYVSSKEHLMIQMNLLRVRFFYSPILTELPNHNHAQPPLALLVLQFCVSGRMRSPVQTLNSQTFILLICLLRFSRCQDESIAIQVEAFHVFKVRQSSPLPVPNVLLLQTFILVG